MCSGIIVRPEAVVSREIHDGAVAQWRSGWCGYVILQPSDLCTTQLSHSRHPRYSASHHTSIIECHPLEVEKVLEVLDSSAAFDIAPREHLEVGAFGDEIAKITKELISTYSRTRDVFFSSAWSSHVHPGSGSESLA